MIKQQLAQLAQWLATPAKIIVIPHKKTRWRCHGQ